MRNTKQVLVGSNQNIIVSGSDYQNDVPHFSPGPAREGDSEIKDG